jgi:hypothetical protein
MGIAESARSTMIWALGAADNTAEPVAQNRWVCLVGPVALDSLQPRLKTGRTVALIQGLRRLDRSARPGRSPRH